MKVYELMSKLAECPCGAEVKCSAAIDVSELKSCEHLGDELYAVYRGIDSVEISESVNGLVYLNC